MTLRKHWRPHRGKAERQNEYKRKGEQFRANAAQCQLT